MWLAIDDDGDDDDDDDTALTTFGILCDRPFTFLDLGFRPYSPYAESPLRGNPGFRPKYLK